MLIIFLVFSFFFLGGVKSGDCGRVMRFDLVDFKRLKGEMSFRKELIFVGLVDLYSIY